MLVYGEEERSYNLIIQANEEEITALNIVSGKIENYTLNFDRAATYKINFIITERK